MNSSQKLAVDTLIHAPWIVPVIPRNMVFHNSAIAIKDGKIQAIVESSQSADLIIADNEHKLEDHALMPGLINSHGHVPMTLFRGIADDIPLKQWLEERIWPLESCYVSPEFVREGAMLACAEMIRSGTTMFADMYFFPEEVAKVATTAGIKCQLACPIMDFPTAWATTPDEYISKTTALHDRYRSDEFVSIAFGPHAPYSVSDEPLQRIRMLADELDIPIHMHVHETAGEIKDSIDTENRRPLARLAELNLLSPRLLCIHATQLTGAEIEILAETGTHVIHCPESNMKLASGLCEVHSLLSSGVNVAIGTDGGASNNDLNMFGEMHTAALLGKVVAKDASAVPAYQALELATINGAKAMGVAHQQGSLEVGKLADIIAVDMNHLNTLPINDPISHLVYSAHAEQVSHVWCNGKLLLENAALKTLDLNTIRADARKWAKSFEGA